MAVNVLLSYAFHAGTDLAKVRRAMVCGRILIDSGAFTAWKGGAVVDRAAYADFLAGWAGQYDHAITLDVVGDPEATATNTRWLHGRGLPVMPVFTPGMGLAEFDAMVADTGYVAVGGVVGLRPGVQRARCAMLQRRAAALGGGIHILGVGSVATISHARPYSSDASTPSSVLRYGNIVIFDGRMLRQIHVAEPRQATAWRTAIRAHGIDLGALVNAQRIPPEARDDLMVSMAVSYIAADEYLRRNWPVQPPTGAHGSGPHLYNSVGVSTLWGVVALDKVLHTAPPPILARHTCERKAVA